MPVQQGTIPSDTEEVVAVAMPLGSWVSLSSGFEIHTEAKQE